MPDLIPNTIISPSPPRSEANRPGRTNLRPAIAILILLVVSLFVGNGLALFAASPGPMTSADVERYLSPRQRLQAAEEMEEHFPASSEASEEGEDTEHQEELNYYLRFTPHHQLHRLRARALASWLAFLALAGIRLWISRRSDQRHLGKPRSQEGEPCNGCRSM